MILVTLGTQDKPFTRLLEAMEHSSCADRIIVQAGFTKFSSQKMDVREYIGKEEFSRLIEEADIVISHGGVGTIMECLRRKKRLIVAPRLAKYGEHQNDHQLEITHAFFEKGYLLKWEEGDDIDQVIEEARTYPFREYDFSGNKFLERLSTYLGL